MTAKKNDGRTINAKRNIIYGFLQVIVSLILPFISRTILIYRFGVDYLGLNSLFASVLSVLSLMELGFGTAVVYSMYKPAAAGLTAYFYILKAGDIRWVYQEGKGLWYESRFIMIGEAAVNTILNILLCRALGVFGIVLATVISVFVTNFIFCPSLLFRLYFKNNKLKEYWKDHLYYGMTMLLTVGISWNICERILPVTMAGKDFLNSAICLAADWEYAHCQQLGFLQVCGAGAEDITRPQGGSNM